MPLGSPRTQISGDKAACLNQRVEDNAFHLSAAGGQSSSYLLPGLTTGILTRSGGSLSAGNVSIFISIKLTNGQPKSGLVAPLRSTITPTAETTPPCTRTMSIVSCTRPPRVTTSSTTTNFSLGKI